MLIDEICNVLLPLAAHRLVADVRVGLGYTVVELDDGQCGLAYTFRYDTPRGCCVIGEAGALVGRRASELAAWAASADPIAAAVGLATLNALVKAPPDAIETDVLRLLEREPDDVIGMVGHFGPLVEPLRKKCRAVHILERHPAAESGLLPESEADEVLPLCQVAILSATTLLNRTLDGLLLLCRNARAIAILGPSTPLLPEVFATRGVTLLSGVQVVDPRRTLRIVSEGGGRRQFGGAVRKVTVRVPKRAAQA